MGRMDAQELRERLPSLERAVRSLKRNDLAKFVVAVRESATTEHRWPADHRFWFDGAADLKLSREEDLVVREPWTRLNAALVFVVTGEEVEAWVDAPGWIARLDKGASRSQQIEGHAATVLEKALGGDIWLGTIGIWNALCAELLADRLEPSLRDDLATSWRKVRPSHPVSILAS
jgi:hypothetical protein